VNNNGARLFRSRGPRAVCDRVRCTIVRILGVELADDTSFVRDDADFAILSARDPGSSIGVDVRLISELPDVGGVATIHLERACWRPELDHEGIDILPDILIAEPGRRPLVERRHNRSNVTAAPSATTPIIRI
jgi:hypothetical protein